MRFAYADPPYRGQCGKRYDHAHPDGPRPFDGRCWDDDWTHELLVMWLYDEHFDGWAISCNPADIGIYHQWIGSDARIAPWCKTWHQIRSTTVQYAWEAVLWRGGREDPKRSPMVRDWFICPATSQRGLVGAKPARFNQWVLDLLAFDPAEDEMVDLFPGTAGMALTLDTPPLTFPA